MVPVYNGRMGQRALLICVLVLLVGGLVAAWLVLVPATQPTATTTDLPEAATREVAQGGPLQDRESDPERAADGADQPGPLPGREAGDTGDAPPRTPVPEGRPAVDTPVPAGDAPDFTPDRQPAPETLPEPPADPAEDPTLHPPFITGHTRPRGQNLGNVRPASRRLATNAAPKELATVTEELRQDRRGLLASYYQLDSEGIGSLTREPLELRTPDFRRIDRQVHFPDEASFQDLPLNRGWFAGVWQGLLVIDKPGDYWLFLGADNGGRIELNGETVLLQDGMVRYVEVSTVLTLAAGLYPLRIEFAQFENNVADWAKCACSLMWVPEGQSKPVPVPPEMLMVPEWMWSDAAPILTSLSRTEGEIGEEIMIRGKNLLPKSEVAAEWYPYVKFAGQTAQILSKSAEELRVRVPIGAVTGDVIVWAPAIVGGLGTNTGDIPSNSLRFEVTTQFGLQVDWYELESADLAAFDPAQLTPKISRIETYSYLWVGSQSEHLLPLTGRPFGCVLTGRMGLPIRGSDQSFFVYSTSAFRGQIGGKEVSSKQYASDEFVVELTLPQDDSYVDLRLEWVSDGGAAALLILHQVPLEGAFSGAIPGRLLFPPTAPPKPPKIDSLVAGPGEDLLPWNGPVYDSVPGRPSVAVGGMLHVHWRCDSVLSLARAAVQVLIDDVPVETTTVVASGAGFLSECIVPPAAREGRVVLRVTVGGHVLDSEPAFVDIQTRGLIAYLYDFPQGSGLAEVPDLAALSCFAIRKHREIRFESAADFDLPFPAETFAIEWHSNLVIELEGDYVFTGRTDDGMRLWINDQLVIDANRLQAPAENKSQPIRLTPGTYHFRMQYFENNQHEVCVLYWQASTGEGAQELIAKQVIPARAFTLEPTPAYPNKQATGKRTDGS